MIIGLTLCTSLPLVSDFQSVSSYSGLDSSFAPRQRNCVSYTGVFTRRLQFQVWKSVCPIPVSLGMKGLGDSAHTRVVVDVVEDDSDTRDGTLGSKVTQRASVFDRLSHPENQIPSYASVVGLKDRLGMDYFPLKDRSSTCIPLPVELTKKAALAFNSTVYGYFLGPRIPFPIVQRMEAAKWGKFGFKDAMLNDNGYFFFRFNDEGVVNKRLKVVH